MADSPPEDDPLQTIRRAERIVHEAGSPPFTPAAYDLLRSRIDSYIVALIEESIRVAKRQHSPDMISVSDVDRASRNLGLGVVSRRAKIMNAVGSLLIGAALGNAIQFVGAQQVTSVNALATLGVGLVGAVMMSTGLLQD